VDTVRACGFDAAQEEAILAGNAARLLALDGAQREELIG
jgi:hypothetical protein